MRKYNFTNIALCLLLLSFNVNSSYTNYSKGLKCNILVNDWTKTEKKLLKNAVTKDSVTDFFFMPTEIFLTKDNNWCRYKNIYFRVGFQESDFGGEVLIFESGKIKSNTKNNKIVLIEYGLYQETYTTEERDDYWDSDYYFNEVFRLRTRFGAGNKINSILSQPLKTTQQFDL
ncbi:hypothetical protein [Bathymodiolus thermophilus thioautotrophic gill symbiont]|uniref:Lipoprotein n=1 Tax=Bathymodiolus thermophilus thioautotrophic gill symbiont TaxID=2360 RepID=A0A1J5TUC4_9GAMM|nr:hypothetical protein [Bathymodiolus thermophilus thioautotrophic gill symbiont]OIR24418.1 hypothetical protein BGC33_03530 [Bathymodiolus thermophilus thioautotrophic gill symbiont]